MKSNAAVQRLVSPAYPQRERGLVLFVALIVMVVMSLAGLALIRSIDTTNLVIGNLAFRQSSILAANFAVEDAGTGLFSSVDPAGTGQIPDLTQDWPQWNYFATYQKSDDPRGVPAQVQKASNFTLTRVLNDGLVNGVAGTNNTIRYVIERMCTATGPAAANTCDMMPPKQAPGDTINDNPAIPLPKIPFYRVTIRVDGPPKTNTVSFVQAMLR